MTAKEYLNQAYWLDKRIDSKLEQLSALKDMATRTTSVMSGEVVSHTRNVSSMQDVIVKIITMENEVNADIDRLVDLKAEIMRVIKAVASLVGGGGGGRPNMAQAGGKNPAGIPDAIAKAKEVLAEQV